MGTTNITMRMDEDLREQRIPFMISRELPNEETLEALEEVRKMKEDSSIGKKYSDVDIMLKELLE